jgi:hypothetical protein
MPNAVRTSLPNIWPQAPEAPIQHHRPVITESTFITTSQFRQYSRHQYNGAQATHLRLRRRAPNYNLHTRAALKVNRERCTRHSAGHIQQICAKDTTAGEVVGHVHDVPGGGGRVAILLRGVGWKLCTYTSFLHFKLQKEALSIYGFD